jgi:hypothetical protein
MAESTRTSDVAQRVSRPGVVSYVVALLLVAGAVWLSLDRGAGAAAVAVVAVLGTGLGLGVMLLPRRWNLPALVVAAIVGSGVLVRVEQPLPPTWIAALLLGVALGVQLLWTRQQQATGPTRPPSPRTATALRSVRDDGPDEVETVDPEPGQVRADVEALDGRSRTGVSVFRGSARLDVGGDAGGTLVVHQCDDTTTRKRPVWWVLAVAEDPWSGPEVDVRVARLDVHLPSGGTTSLAPAVRALDAFLASGGRAPDLPWRTGRDTDDLRAVFDVFR